MTGRPRLLLLAAALGVLAVGLPWSSHQVALDVPIVIRSSIGGVEVVALDVIHSDTGLNSVVLGTQHPVRVLGLVGLVGVWLALRRGSRAGALAALAAAAAALPIGAWEGPQPGRVCYLLALGLAAAVIVADGRSARAAANPEPGSRPA